MSKNTPHTRRQRKALRREIQRSEGGQVAGRPRTHKKSGGVGTVLLCITLVILILLLLALGWMLLFEGRLPLLNSPGAQPGAEGATEKVPLAAGADAGEAYVDESLFVGDSNTVRLGQYDLAPLVAAKQGIGIGAVRTLELAKVEGVPGLLTIPQAAAQLQPARVVMTFGTNDLSPGLSVEGFVEEYQLAIEAIRDAAPGSDIIVCAIPPFAQYSAYSNLQLPIWKQCNEALQQMCREVDVAFLNTAEVLAGQDGYVWQRYTDDDGVHLNEEGLNAFLDYYRTHPLV